MFMIRKEIPEIVAYTENTDGSFSVDVLADTTIINHNSLLTTSFVEEENQA